MFQADTTSYVLLSCQRLYFTALYSIFIYSQTTLLLFYKVKIVLLDAHLRIYLFQLFQTILPDSINEVTSTCEQVCST
jgi:hypothetical protein